MSLTIKTGLCLYHIFFLTTLLSPGVHPSPRMCHGAAADGSRPRVSRADGTAADAADGRWPRRGRRGGHGAHPRRQGKLKYETQKVPCIALVLNLIIVFFNIKICGAPLSSAATLMSARLRPRRRVTCWARRWEGRCLSTTSGLPTCRCRCSGLRSNPLNRISNHKEVLSTLIFSCFTFFMFHVFIWVDSRVIWVDSRGDISGFIRFIGY